MKRGLWYHLGRAIAQAVSCWLPTAAARVQARVWSCGICGGQSGAGAGILRVLRFPLPIFIPPIAPQSPPSIIWGWYNRPEVAAVPSGLSPIPLIIKIIIILPFYLSLYQFVSVFLSMYSPPFFLVGIMRSPCCVSTLCFSTSLWDRGPVNYFLQDEGPVPGRGPTVEKHSSIRLVSYERKISE
jgi:hypothetical protein